MMAPRFKVLEGLPPYGPLAPSFPREWGQLGREGIVVEFDAPSGRWVANFKPGLGGLRRVFLHPNHRHVIVVALGDLWIVNPESREAEWLLPAIDKMVEVENPEGWVLSRQGLALARLTPEGLAWHTRRLSWDGFDDLKIIGGELTGLAWSAIDDNWHAFRVDLKTGRSSGGSFSDEDTEGWERLSGI